MKTTQIFGDYLIDKRTDVFSIQFDANGSQ